ncbi:hypothetical protein [Paraliomyxa miuraensis]|uniref:hypothetical protein n=1 Tax=Paraliomyxa miuraensis TaxID=376150 RepID=UPI0022593036|nr:hypothetical protein [Paraliomyxa miuraensis]MCX4243729.1 hypothetical protein [Paraliomyxa miuraensis]
MSRRPPTAWLLGVALGLLTVVLLARGHRDVGYARDEGVYFEASRHYAAWVAEVAKEPGRLSDRKLRDRHFAINHEHPVLMKTLAGLAARALAAPAVDPRAKAPASAGGMPEGAAMRLPAQIIAGLGVSLLFFAGWAWGGIGAGLLAAGWFILLPRVAFNAGLHAFDVPVAVASLGVVLAYRASASRRAWGIAVGPLLGIAIAVKHNALFLGPLLALHYYACLMWGRWRHGRTITRAQWVPLPLVSMAVLAPLVAWALWPWMWSDTTARLLEYLEFHRNHSWYNMELLGRNYNQPPMPISYAVIMTWATVPTTLLLLAGIGLGLGVRRELRAPAAESADPPRFAAPLPSGWSRLDPLLLGMLGLFPIALISLPSTPIFGGTKHWITAYPFLALAAAVAWRELWQAVEVPKQHRRWLAPLGLALCLGPAAAATADGHPYNLSQYAPLAGGPRGAADLGLNRGFWGHAVHELWPTLEQTPGPIHLHDMHELARKQYEREGRWPGQLQPTSVRRARSGLMFYELHMTTDEVALWEQLGTTVPLQVLSLDDVPLTSLYVEPADPAGRGG